MAGPFELVGSPNIVASGEDTTVQLTPPNGKTTGDFQTGRIQDDENPTDLIDLASDKYTEIEWCIKATDEAEVDATYEFRVTKLWLPTKIAGCVLWLRSDLGITKDGGNLVSGWADQSGNGNNFGQTTDANKPIWTVNTVNGHPALVFFGDVYSQLTSSFSITQPNIWFIVFKMTDDPLAGYRFLIDGTAGRQLFGKTGGTGKWTIYAGGAGEVFSAGVSDNLPHIGSALFNGGSSQVWLEGQSIITGNPGSNTSENVTIGKGVGDGGLEGWIAEVICYDATSFTDENRQRVELYLNTESQGTGYAIY